LLWEAPCNLHPHRALCFRDSCDVRCRISGRYLVQLRSRLRSRDDAALVDNFESFSPKDVNLPSAVSGGITYTPTGTGTNVVVASPGYTNFGAGVNPTTTSILTASGNEDFVGVLTSPASPSGFDVFLNGLGPASATFFNGATLLGRSCSQRVITSNSLDSQ
jgi:hypothetical protein